MMIITGALLIPGCKKKETTPPAKVTPPTSTSFADFEFSGIFNGSLYSAGSNSPIEGYVTIDAAGATTLDLLSGRMTGTSVKTGGNYNITITQVTGIFQNVTNISGTIEISTRTLYLSGTSMDGTQVTLGGKAVEVMTTAGWEKLKKSAIYFTHNESCLASITINGVTLSGLNRHYSEGGYCNPLYDLWRTIHQDNDNAQSKVFCHDIKLLMLDKTYKTFTDCNTAAFYLNKNTSYNYTVNWENGQKSSGTFTSPSGGGNLPICISNDGPECNHSLDQKWIGTDGTGFKINGTRGNFYVFGGNWKILADKGIVAMGETKIRNIKEINATTWSCQILFLRMNGGKPDEVAWSADGTIIMSNYGHTITMSATSPFGSGIASATYALVL